MEICYLVAGVLAVLISDRFLPVLRQPWSWWLVPVIVAGIWLLLLLLHAAIVLISFTLVRTDRQVGKRRARYFRGLVDLTLPMLFRLLRVRVELTGKEKLPANGRFLLVCNHLNIIDPAVLLYALPEAELGFIGKKEIYDKMPFFGKAMHALHGLPLDRENNREAAKTILTAAELLKNDVVSVGIFPEGHRSPDGELQPMHPGSFKIACRAGAPIAVCAVTNTPAVFRNLLRRKTELTLDVAQVISAERVAQMNTNEICDEVFRTVSEVLSARRAEK